MSKFGRCLFIYGLDQLNGLYLTLSEIGRMNNELERILKEAVETSFKVLCRRLFGGTEKTHVKSQDSRSWMWDPRIRSRDVQRPPPDVGHAYCIYRYPNLLQHEIHRPV